MKKLISGFVVLIATASVFFCTALNPTVARASVVDVITNGTNFIQNSSNAVNDVAQAKNDVLTPELQQQLQASGRLDDAQSLISSLCVSGDTQCAGKIMALYASNNEVSNPNSSFRQAVNNTQGLDSSLEDLGGSGAGSNPVPAAAQEIAQPPVWLQFFGWVPNVINAVTDFLGNHAASTAKNKTAADIAGGLPSSSGASAQSQPISKPSNEVAPTTPTITNQPATTQTLLDETTADELLSQILKQDTNQEEVMSVSGDATTGYDDILGSYLSNSSGTLEQEGLVTLMPNQLVSGVPWRITTVNFTTAADPYLVTDPSSGRVVHVITAVPSVVSIDKVWQASADFYCPSNVVCYGINYTMAHNPTPFGDAFSENGSIYGTAYGMDTSAEQLTAAVYQENDCWEVLESTSVFPYTFQKICLGN